MDIATDKGKFLYNYVHVALNMCVYIMHKYIKKYQVFDRTKEKNKEVLHYLVLLKKRLSDQVYMKTLLHLLLQSM